MLSEGPPLNCHLALRGITRKIYNCSNLFIEVVIKCDTYGMWLKYDKGTSTAHAHAYVDSFFPLEWALRPCW